MNDVLPWLFLALLFAVCAVRQVTPNALSPHEIRARLQACGWRRICGRTLQVAVVLVLLLLAAALQFCWQTLQVVAVVLVVIASGIGSLDPPKALPRGEVC